MITFIYGPEDFLSSRAFDRISDGMEVRTTDSVSDEDIMWVNDISLLGGSRLLVLEVEELGACDELLKHLTEGDITGDFAVKARKVKSNTKIFKWLSSNAKLYKCEPLNDALFEKFLRRNDENVHLRISDENLEYLKCKIDYQSGRYSLFELDLILQLLSMFNEVTKKDIDAYINVSAEKKAFDIINLFASKKYSEGIRAAAEYEDSCIQAISAMLWSFKLSILLKTFRAEEIGATPFQARNVKPFLAYPVYVLEDVFKTLNDGLKKMKNGMPEKACFIATLGLVQDRLS